MATKYSYSRVGCYTNCPRSFKYRYIDGLRTIEDQNADNALFLGTALHLGLETGDVDGAIEDYKSHYFVITNEVINECIKLEYVIPKALELLPSGLCEEKLEDDYFIGYIDRLVPKYTDENGIKHFDLYDYKYCAEGSVPRYLASGQLSIYKWKFEKLNEGCVIDHLYFLIIPKVRIRQKKTETVQTFRLRLQEELEKTNIRLEEVEYNPDKIEDYFGEINRIETETEFPKNESRLCDWCQYKNWCLNGDDSDLLIDFLKLTYKGDNEEMVKKLWLYGSPFSGKTTFACGAPNHYVLSTDGNAQYTTDSYKVITDEVKVEGRLTKRKLAWDVLKDEISRLEAERKYETIILDLVEDTYEMCRLYMYQKLGITHESDDTFRAWDKVRTEYLSTMRRFINLPYNIILISHEDTTKDITKRSGENITAIKPNITDKVANKLAGMVALVGRAIVDGDKYTLSVKTDEVTFGGGRLGVSNCTLPLDYDAVAELFENMKGNKK